MRAPKLTIVVDSNERYHGKAWKFPVTTTTKSLLEYGCDYSVRGLVGTIGVERKSYSDLVRCLGSDWKRFQKQLAKLRRNKFYTLIVEGHIDSPIYYDSLMNHSVVVQQVARVVASGVPVIFAGSRAKAASLCLRFMEETIKRIRDGV